MYFICSIQCYYTGVSDSMSNLFSHFGNHHKLLCKFEKVFIKKIKFRGLQVFSSMILYFLSSGSGGMADALDSGSSGSLSCESSSLFFRMKPITIVVMGFLFFPVFIRKMVHYFPETQWFPGFFFLQCNTNWLFLHDFDLNCLDSLLHSNRSG